jgi:uracil-DNA glycosylase
MSHNVPIEPEWEVVLASFFETELFKNMSTFVKQEFLSKKVYPKQKDIFKAFTLTSLSQVKVVILGQDPYHKEGQACGLCFSVLPGTPLPPSLKNIYKEIESEFRTTKDYTNGNLESWANQGVFLLNSVLTVVANSPLSHQGKGWEEFTDTVIKTISEKQDHVVFMMWGNFAKSKKALIDTNKHLVLEAAHPSPFSAYSGFFGCNHFIRCNEFLRNHNQKEIIW